MDEPAHPGTWSVGELVAASGVTVRTLHHYDRLGLVVPSTRTPAGHRRYTDGDVRRLYQVLALRWLGLGLNAIAAWLDADSEPDLLALMRQHLNSVDRDMRRYEQLRGRLARLVEVLERTGRTTANDLIEVMERMRMYDDHLTAEQLTRLERDRSELGFPGIDRWRLDAEEALLAFRAAFEIGVAPTDPHVQALVRQILDLKRQFVGHDHGVSRALRDVHEDSRWDEVRAVLSQEPELRAFWKRARAATNA